MGRAARVIRVIETDELIGRGVPGDPVRRVKQFFSLNGVLLAKVDEWKDAQDAASGTERRQKGS